VPGRHNVRNAALAIAACAEGFGVSLGMTRTALASFEGVRRRQDLLGTPAGIRVYDDFAHHPTAVSETLAALRAKHEGGALWAVFEPRSATACRTLHQEAYARAFDAATHVILAPLGRSNVPEAERLDLLRLARDLGPKAEAAPSAEAILLRLQAEAKAGDTVAILSNGAFDGLPARLLQALATASEGTR
jgi:UDP-N-acetylmuramate: L-alanyl-gamma-D-glutamyl-meso-diaminopimelate ligase